MNSYKYFNFTDFKAIKLFRPPKIIYGFYLSLTIQLVNIRVMIGYPIINIFLKLIKNIIK